MSIPLEVLFRRALARTGIEVFVWDVAADTITTMRGGEPAETIDHARTHLLNSVDPRDRAAFERELQEAIDTHAPLEHEYRTDGRWARIAAAFDGELLAATMVDITAEKNRHSAYEELVDDIPYSIARVDLDGRYLYVNRGGVEIVNPDTARMIRDAEQRLIETGESQHFEITNPPNFPGHTLDILFIPERDESGRLASILRVIRDVTRIKESEAKWRESEERLRLAARASLAMIYDWNMVTNVTFRSDAVRELTGFSPEETERSEWWISDIHPDDRERAEARVREAIEKGEDRYENEYRVRHREGTWRWVWDRGFIVRDESGRAVRAVGSTVDVTARRLVEEELKAAHRREQEARAEAEQANRAKDDFLATLSHELRTPMTSILGWTSMLASGMVEPQTMALAVRSLHDSARSQAQLIEDLLDLSRIANGKISIERGPLNLGSVVASSVESFRVAAAAQSIDLRASIGTSDVLILGDEKRMRQIVTNLVSNALKFTPTGGRVEVTLAQDDASAIVSVRDTGVGIEPKFLPHVFDRFSQQEMGENRFHGGLGLGLAIVRQLVELHGGSVQAESVGARRGSLFTVTLPRIPAAIRPPHESTAPAKSAPRLDGVRVLLVEDEPNSRKYMEAVLASSGATVQSAASVAEALGTEGEPSVIVSDIAMPGEDGLSLITKLRKRDALIGRRTPAVAVTALGFGDDRRRILSAGFDQYLAKPVEAIDLLETVAALVGDRGFTR